MLFAQQIEYNTLCIDGSQNFLRGLSEIPASSIADQQEQVIR